MHSIQFIDLTAQQKHIRAKIDTRIKDVLDHGHYIMGPEVDAFEKALSEFCGAKHSISCANGTDALGLVLMAKNVGKGDAVFVPTFTFAATAEVVAWVDATPIFIDIDPKTFNMCPKSLEKGIEVAQKLGLKPTAIIPVDLFGLPADFDAIEALAQQHNMWILDDAAQGFGGVYKGRPIGTCGLATTTSFFPAKPLGCYGDGGAIFTDDDALADIIKSLRIHGKGTDKYDNVRIGMNGRLDTLQCAILLEKLAIFPEEIKARNIIAKKYNDALQDSVKTPKIFDDLLSTWAQYTMLLPKGMDRDGMAQKLKAKGVPTAIYYPTPLHQQTAYRHYPSATTTLPFSEDYATRVLSLPMHPYLDEATQNYIIDAVKQVLSS
jgi:dTDP-4-amino-4,6-dideoxygalactose transaminase